MEVLRGQRLARLSDLDATRRRGSRAALIDGEEVLTYVDLADRVELRVAELGPNRQLVTLRATNSIDTIVTYLACLTAGHVVSIRSSDQPDPYASATGSDLHPELAVLMSTSGSTGSAKAVRLSLDNVEANAVAIADALELRFDDVAITSLPLHYCYGLSIVTSHLAVGAAIVVTDTSVADSCFWKLVDRWDASTVSGVPHSFDLIERMATDPLAAPSLRRVTQAGGRLAPEKVQRLSRLGGRRGWDFVVMYGQTEATARMATLDPQLAADHPGSIGRPIPGGAFRLAPIPSSDVSAELQFEARIGAVGEIVYRGRNVMLGYATSVDDLGRGRDLDELRTGDIGRRLANGLFEIVGRRSRFVKILGHRIDLEALEADLTRADVEVAAAGTDDRLVVAVVGDAEGVRQHVAALPVPASTVQVIDLDGIPRLASGKVDAPAILSLVDDTRSRLGVARDAETPTQVFRDVLGVDNVGPHDTFASLGGDSLSYVEASIRLERVLGDLPNGWHVRSVAELGEDAPQCRRRFTTRIDTSVVIRAIGICVIVATHMRVARLAGGAHTLLAVAGYNFARFQLVRTGGSGAVRRGLATVGRVAVPTSLWIGLQMLLVGGYSAGSLFLVNNYFGSAWRRDGRWEYWYFEAFVQIFLVLTLLFAIGPVRRLERRQPFMFVFVALMAATAVGLQLVELGDGYNNIFRPHATVWFVLIGWAGQVAVTNWQRLLVTTVLVGGTPLYFDRWQQALLVTVLVGALLWLPTVRVPRLAAPVLGVVAAASMVTFLIHWQVWPIYTSVFTREVAFVLTLATGVAVWAIGRRLARSDVVHAAGRRIVRRILRRPA
jgi:acyl-CoA synthetase (AMP-forming)/AMP-acid ligase II